MIGGLSDKDIELHALQMSGTTVDEGFIDTVQAGFAQGIVASPVTSAFDFFKGKLDSSEPLSADEANTKYGLTGTPVAFKAGESTTDVKAKIAADRFHEDEYYQSVRDRGVWGAGFLGNLAAGFVDPINLATGIGTAAVVKKVGAMTIPHILANPSIKQVLGMQIAENFAGTILTEATIVPLAEDVRRRPIGMTERVVNILGSTVMGAGLGTVLDPVGRIATKKFIGNLIDGVGGNNVDNVAKEINEHVAKTVSLGKVPDVESVIKRNADMLTMPRTDDIPYVRQELPTYNSGDQLNLELDINNIEWFVAHDLTNSKLNTKIVDKGDGTFTFLDDHHTVKNSVLDLTGDKRGQIFSFKTGLKSKILSNASFNNPEIRASIIKNIVDVLESGKHSKFSAAHMRKLGKQGQTDFLELASPQGLSDKLKTALEKSGSIEDLEQKFVDAMIDLDFNKEDALNALNKALYNTGFNGRVGVHTFANGHSVNALTLFDPKAFDPNYQGMPLMEANHKGFQNRGVKAVNINNGKNGIGSRLFYRSDVFEHVNAGDSFGFDPSLPSSQKFLTELEAKYKSSSEHIASYKSDIDYNADAMAELNSKPVVTEDMGDYTKVDIEKEFDELGVTDTELEAYSKDPEFEQSVNNMKKADKLKEALKAAHKCFLKAKGL